MTVFSRTQTPPTSRLKPLACWVVVAMATQLIACSSINEFMGGDKVDYRTSGGKKGPGLDVPPDLTQLSRDSRYQPSSGAVNASTFQASTSAGNSTAVTATVLPAVAATSELTIERAGNQRWLSTNLPPEKLWPQLQSFWTERGFYLTTDQADIGIMETEWAENRAKLPQDIIRQTIGRVFDSAYSTGERDKFRTRVERTAKGSEVYISHRGVAEVYTNSQKENTVWQARPTDVQLEAEFLQRLLVKLGTKEEVAKAAVTQSPTAPARARVVAGAGAATMQLDEGFDRAWRRVGLALDRAGFTVEDRDRSQGIYFVRYVDPAQGKKEEQGFFGKVFSFGGNKETSNLARYRVNVKSEGERSTVAVLSAQGADNTGEVGKRIVNLLVEDLK